MATQPNSIIKLLADVPIDDSQVDTLWFRDVSTQTQYFLSKAVATFTEQSYQRVNRDYCRVYASADSLYNVNYMMFQNTSYLNKWFYAFVLDVEYINEAVAEVHYVIDPIQTWLHDYTAEQCFVERMTPWTDDIGEHIEPENVDLGEYIINGNYDWLTDDLSSQSIVVVYDDPNGNDSSFYNRVFSSYVLKVWGTTSDEISSLQDFIESVVADSIIAIYMCPASITGNLTGGETIEYGGGTYLRTVTKDAITTDTRIDGYLPRNRKLYTYPYNFYHIDTPNGGSLVTRYEYFRELKPQFNVTGNATAPVELVCIPTNYKGVRETSALGGAQEFRNERLSIKGFPQCCWSSDAFNEWVTQSGLPRLTQIIGGGYITGATSGALGQSGTRTESTIVGGIIGLLSDGYKASVSADITKGSYETGNNDYASGRMNFKCCRMSIHHNLAERIDNYFTAFGYAIGKIATPFRHTRTRFTYIKTIGCNITGTLPARDAKAIADCYNRGIRFWADVNRVNNYEPYNDFIGQQP